MQRTALLGLNLIPSILVTKPFDELEDTFKPLEALYLCDLQVALSSLSFTSGT